MAICNNCGRPMPDSAKFCNECGAQAGTYRISYRQNDRHAFQSREARTVYEGSMHKCIFCGETLQSFMIRCPSCGEEQRGTSPASSVSAFARKLEEIEMRRPREKRSSLFKNVFKDNLEIDPVDEQKISLIRSFVFPNTREELLEFLILASSNIDLNRYNDFSSISRSHQAVSDAWEAKFEQAYEKACFAYSNDPEFDKIRAIYNKKKREVNNSKRKRVHIWIGIVVGIILIYGVLFFLVNNLTTADEKKIKEENARLEVIVEEVYKEIEEGDYTMARAKAASLVFLEVSTPDGNQAALQWDETRAELLGIIDNAEQEAAVPADDQESDPSTTQTSVQTTAQTTGQTTQTTANTTYSENEPSPTAANIDSFVVGYEKADFDKYNSLASENGLGDTPMYITGTLERTEVLEADGTMSILGHVVDEYGNRWLCQMHIIPVVPENHYAQLINRSLVFRGVYSGFSAVREQPVFVLDELLDIETGERFYGMQKLLDN